ncbi:MAG: hypothetical protein HYU52_06120 [Acidobacteria bacterium]|nr:hypothetical protein [Acidobacteriota bacterium]
MAKRSLVSLVFCFIFLAGGLSLQADKRVFLGERTVTNRGEKDVFVVKGNDWFRKIQFETRRAGVEIFDLKVHYEGGGVQDIEVKSFIEPGSWSREIDLNGGERRIEKVVFTYRASPKGRRQAVVRLYGIR